MKISRESWTGPPAGMAEVGLRSFLNRLVNRRTKRLREERLRFAALLSELSAGLIHVPAGKIDAALAGGLQQVATFLGVDRANLEEYEQYGGGEPPGRLGGTRPGLEEPPSVMDTDQFPWSAETLRRGKAIRFS